MKCLTIDKNDYTHLHPPYQNVQVLGIVGEGSSYEECRARIGLTPAGMARQTLMENQQHLNYNLDEATQDNCASHIVKAGF